MLIMSLFYSVGLWMTGLKSALPIGIVAGILVFVPYLGVIVGVRQIDIASPGTTGAIAGAAAGGIAGSQATEGAGAALTALGGSIVGGILGTTVEKKLNDTFGYEYVVRKANGDIVQTEEGEALIDEGLADGEKVVVDGQSKLQPGSKIVLGAAGGNKAGQPAAGQKPGAHGQGHKHSSELK